MRFLLLPTKFLSPESMGQGDITVWTNWICEETNLVMSQLEEELEARADPDDPFNGSANGVYQPLQENFSLPPPIQTPKRQDTSKHQESSQNLHRSPGNDQKERTMNASLKQDRVKIKMQAALCESEEHLLGSLGPRSS